MPRPHPHIRRDRVAHSHELGGSFECAFSIPFLPFDIEPLRLDCPDGSMSNRGADECAEKEFPKSEKVFPRLT